MLTHGQPWDYITLQLQYLECSSTVLLEVGVRIKHLYEYYTQANIITHSFYGRMSKLIILTTQGESANAERWMRLRERPRRDISRATNHCGCVSLPCFGENPFVVSVTFVPGYFSRHVYGSTAVPLTTTLLIEWGDVYSKSTWN